MALLSKAEFFIPKPSLSVPSTFKFVEWKHVSEFTHYANELKINHLHIYFLTSVVLSGHIQNFSTTEGKKKFGLRGSTLPKYVT